MQGRLHFERWPAAVYAIGDIHGCYQHLVALEHEIVADGATIAGEKWIVTLGDHLDRGPDSAGVIAHVTGTAPQGFRRISLRGNHEQMMLDFLRDPAAHEYWLAEGGFATLASYGIGLAELGEAAGADVIGRILAAVPERHLAFIASLPFMLTLPGWLFVHAGIRPGVAIEQQRDADLIWIREPFLTAAPTPGWRVVHGHTPGPEPVVSAARICVDTQCFATGQLTAVRVTPDGDIRFLAVAGEASRTGAGSRT
ncbi:MAG TPA: serine/threonine protein phosphatase [Alphaproteobacteria bacterium]|nr:serine/threonine protein phosphatase [Alphaproteobacteria bacterium]